MRIDDGDRRRHRDHRFDRVAAFGEDRPACFNGTGMRCADDAAAVTGSVKLDHAHAVAGRVRRARACATAPRGWAAGRERPYRRRRGRASRRRHRSCRAIVLPSPDRRCRRSPRKLRTHRRRAPPTTCSCNRPRRSRRRRIRGRSAVGRWRIAISSGMPMRFSSPASNAVGSIEPGASSEWKSRSTIAEARYSTVAKP